MFACLGLGSDRAVLQSVTGFQLSPTTVVNSPLHHAFSLRIKFFLGCSKKALQRSAEETACTSGNQPSVMAAGGLRPRQLALISLGKPVASSRQRGIKPQRKNAGRRKSKQHPYHPHPKPSSVKSAVGGAHQESVCTATNDHARIDH